MGKASIDTHGALLGGALLLLGAACDDGNDTYGDAGGSRERMDGGTTDERDGGTDAGDEVVGDPQTPPQGAEAVLAWLEGGAYLAWACEPEVHASRSPSPHGYNRICANDVVASAADDDGPWPEGAATVKELYDGPDATEVAGYAVALKTDADSAGGESWYWYEILPGGSVVADGLGDGGPEASICVSCHIGAGADEARTPTPGARDQIFTPVK